MTQATEKINIPNSSKSGNSFVMQLDNKGNFYQINNRVFTSHLFVRVNVDDHEYFKREGDNILTNHYISVSQAVLGAELFIRTLHGIKQVKLRRYKDKIVLMNEGLDRRGKHIAKIIVKFPSILNEEQERIFKQIGEFENNHMDQREILKKEEKC